MWGDFGPGCSPGLGTGPDRSSPSLPGNLSKTANFVGLSRRQDGKKGVEMLTVHEGQQVSEWPGGGPGQARGGARPIVSPAAVAGRGSFPLGRSPGVAAAQKPAVCCNDPQLTVVDIKLQKEKHYFKSDLKD